MIPDRLRWLVEPGTLTVELGERFASAGHELYLVGGSVRDALLDRPDDDFDFATDARPEQIKAVVAPWADAIYTVGETFGTIGVVKNGRTLEITTFRAEVYRTESRKPTVAFSDRIEDDLARRDFACNAIALRLPGAEPIDPFGGLADLAAARLRTPLDPHLSFGDDPLRMLRLFRFQATLGFTPAPEAVAAVTEMADRLDIVSSERIRDEFAKLVVAPDPTDAMWGLVETGLIDRFLPEMHLMAMEQDPIHRHKDVLAHTIAVMEKTDPGNLRLRLAALLHDIGKPATRQFGPRGVTFHHHEVVGARMARERLRSLRFPKEVVEDVARLVFLHLRPHTLKMGWTDAAVRRYVRDAGHLLEDLNQLVRCDVTTSNERRARTIQNRIDELEIRIVQLEEQEELAALRAPIDGHAVMTLLGVKPGPIIGEVMELLMERRIEEGPYSEEEAQIMVLEFGRNRGLIE